MKEKNKTSEKSRKLQERRRGVHQDVSHSIDHDHRHRSQPSRRPPYPPPPLYHHHREATSLVQLLSFILPVHPIRLQERLRGSQLLLSSSSRPHSIVRDDVRIVGEQRERFLVMGLRDVQELLLPLRVQLILLSPSATTRLLLLHPPPSSFLVLVFPSSSSSSHCHSMLDDASESTDGLNLMRRSVAGRASGNF